MQGFFLTNKKLVHSPFTFQINIVLFKTHSIPQLNQLALPVLIKNLLCTLFKIHFQIDFILMYADEPAATDKQCHLKEFAITREHATNIISNLNVPFQTLCFKVNGLHWLMVNSKLK